MHAKTPLHQWLTLRQPFLTSEARAAGFSADALSGAVAGMELVRLHPAVYAVPAAWDEMSARDQHRGLSRAAAQAQTSVVLSHASAAVWHGLPHPWGLLGKARP